MIQVRLNDIPLRISKQLETQIIREQKPYGSKLPVAEKEAMFARIPIKSNQYPFRKCIRDLELLIFLEQLDSENTHLSRHVAACTRIPEWMEYEHNRFESVIKELTCNYSELKNYVSRLRFINMGDWVHSDQTDPYEFETFEDYIKHVSGPKKHRSTADVVLKN